MVVIVPACSITLVRTNLTIVTLTAGLVTPIPGTKLVRLSISIAVAIQIVVFCTLVTMLSIQTGMMTRGRTLTELGVVTPCGTVEHILFKELTIRATVFCNRTRARVRTVGTLVAIAIGTSVGTLFGVYPSVRLTSEDVIADTLH